jgi:hypothetical protein
MFSRLVIYDRVNPIVIIFNELNELRQGLVSGYVLFHTNFAFVERHISGSGANISVVGISHFTGAVYDASHHAYFQADEVRSCSFDFGECALEVKESATATGASDVFGFGDATASGLEYAA